jgi:hypothetical protein
VIRLGSAAAQQAGVASPDSTAGASTQCLAYLDYGTSVGSGGYGYVDFTFPSSPFVVGSMFNETTQTRYAEESEYQSGDSVTVTALNNSSGTESLDGFYGVLYNSGSGGC